MTEMIAGYKSRRLEDGVSELLEPGPSWFAGGFGIFWGGLGVFAILSPDGWEAGWATPVLLLIVWVLPGAALVFPFIRRLLFEGSWLLRGGEIAWRLRLRGSSLTRDGRFQAVRHVEVRHGVWKTGGGSTDICRFYLYEATRPVALASRDRKTREVDPQILALAELVASALGRKVGVLTEAIKEPSGD